MENSFFEYRDETTRKSDSDSEIIDNSLVVEDSFIQIPKSAKKNQTVFVAESEESDTNDETESYDEVDEDELPDVSKSIVRRSSAAGRRDNSSSDEEASKRGSIGRQSPNSSKAVVLSSSSDEEISPEIVPKRRPPQRPKPTDNKSSDSPLIRRVKRRMVLDDSENDNSIVVEKEKNKKVQCLKDTPVKIDHVDRFAEQCLPQNMSVMSDDESGSDKGGDEDSASGEEEEEPVTDDDEAGYPDEDEMVMSKATRMSIMGVRPKDLGSDESDFIQSSDESNAKSRLSTYSLNDLPDAGISFHKTPVKSPENPTIDHPDDKLPSNDHSNNDNDHGNNDNENLDDSRISCSTFGSPVQDSSFTKDNGAKNNVSLTKEIGTKEQSFKVKTPLKEVNAEKVQRFIIKVEDDDDDVTIVDREPEIIALSSDDEEEPAKPVSLKKSPRASPRKSPLKPANAPAKDNTLRQYLAPNSYPNSGVVYVKKHVRENELSKLNELQADLHNVRHLLDNMDVSSLPDGGVKLIERLSGLEMEVRRQGDKVANMVVEPDDPPANVANDGFGELASQGLTWDDIQKASNQVQPKMFGKQAMSTHMAERNLILDRLRDLHESLASRPPETTSAMAPRGLKSTLMPHQLHALAWLQWRETQHPAGGILADDMGLGKTITMIALVVSAKEAGIGEEDDDDDDDEWGNSKENSRLVRGGTLVVCPASVLQQWAGEVTTHCAPHTLSVCLHHGAARATQPRRLSTQDLVLTTYNILQRDTEKNGVLMRIRWSRIILDEAHIVRNHKSATSTGVSALKGAKRWCLTGTPVQNKDLDVFALLKFLRCTPFDDLTMWKKWIDNKSLGGQERLSTIMRCLLLRRTKAQLQQRGQLSCLPQRELHKIQVNLSKEEMNVYQKVLVFSKTLFAQFLHQRAEKQADAGSSSSSQKAYDKMHKRMVQLHGAKPVKSHEILVLLLRLRQVCCHCGLIAAMLDGQEDTGDLGEDAGSVDLLSELNKLSLEDAAKEKFGGNHKEEDEEEPAPQEGTTVAEAIRSVLSPNNPVFQLTRMSSKINAVMECLHKQVFNNKGHKAVVVSQWTSVLKLVEEELKRANVKSCTLSGVVPVPARPPLIQALNNPDSPVKVMLLSLCAGGVGLNLCGANHLLLLDPHWNPQLEEQAQDRIYRVGQTRDVHIYRFMCVDTVEQSIRALQEAKLQLADNVLTGAKHNNASKLSIEDLKMLFNMGPSGE